MESRSRWGRWTGVVVMSVAALAVLRATTAADALGVGPPPDCPAQPVASGGAGAWFRLDPVVVDGTLVAQRAWIGRAGGGGWTVDLPAEAFVAAPRGGLLLVGADDGRTSTVTMVDVVSGCGWLAATASDVIRGAALAPDGRTWFEHRLRRADRADLGVWRRDPAAGTSRRILPPLPTDGRFGITWRTGLSWDEEGRRLVVQTCGEVACRTRITDPATTTVRTIAQPDLGTAVGLVGERLIVRAACRGLPCPLMSVDLATDITETVVDEVGAADLVVDGDGRPKVVYTTAGQVQHLRAADLGRGIELDLGALANWQRLVGPSPDVGREAPPGTVVIVADTEVASAARDASASSMPTARRLVDLAASAAEDRSEP